MPAAQGFVNIAEYCYLISIGSPLLSLSLKWFVKLHIMPTSWKDNCRATNEYMFLNHKKHDFLFTLTNNNSLKSCIMFLFLHCEKEINCCVNEILPRKQANELKMWGRVISINMILTNYCQWRILKSKWNRLLPDAVARHSKRRSRLKFCCRAFFSTRRINREN